jgi:[protein-PII] uridylyltransferase
LFDAQTFDAALATVAEPLLLFKQQLSDAAEQIEQAYYDGTSVREIVQGRSWLMDALLTRAWKCHHLNDPAPLCLIAVGGYGRGELHPGSDIDLLILFSGQLDRATEERISAFITFLWDLGLDIGHSVRSMQECLAQATADITIATNLMESRLLSGQQAIFLKMGEQTSSQQIWSSEAFFRAKLNEQIQRHHKYSDTAYHLEPNVKTSPGGLRDIQMVGWVAKRHFGAQNLHELVEQKFLTESEYQLLMEGQDYLWRVRLGLHLLAKRKEDRLLFDYQRQLARQFGFHDTDMALAVEAFMKRYFCTVMELEQLNEMLLQHFEEAILLAKNDKKPVSVNSRFQNNNGYLEAVDVEVFKRHPFALLEIFLLLQQDPSLKGIRASTIRLIRQHQHLIDDKFRANLGNRSLFMEIVRQPRGITHEFRRMNKYGVLGRYLPNFGRIVGQTQHDLFHIYTVDQHTLFLVRNLRRFFIDDHADELPLCNQVAQKIAKPHLLYLTGLFHDVAKGRGGDHSKLGATDALNFCISHGLGRYDARLVAWLVENHLVMSMTAQRKDISDPDVIHEFAQLIGDQTHLNNLYLLTVADIRATNPKLWNSWRDALLADLYRATRAALRRGLENPIDRQELIETTQQEVRMLLTAHQIRTELIDELFSQTDAEYFLRYSVSEIAWQIQCLAKHSDPSQPLVRVRACTERGGTEVFVYDKCGEHRFAAITTTLEKMNLNIVDARIITTQLSHTLDTYIILELDHKPIENSERLQEIESQLSQVLRQASVPAPQINRSTPRVLKQFPIPPHIAFSYDEPNHRTALEIIAADRPGLLAQIAHVFMQSGIKLQNAKITTLGERVEDVFFVTDAKDCPLTDPAICEQLRENILRRLEASES